MTRRGIVLGAVSPHPPIVVPEIGENNLDRVQKTRDGLQQLAGLVRGLNPDTVVIIAPHGPVVRGAVTLLSSPILEGNFREFGISGTSLRYGNDVRFVNRVQSEAADRGVQVVAADPTTIRSLRVPGALHYSILVPLYYLRQAGVESRLVAGAVGMMSAEDLYTFGRSVQAAAGEMGVRVVYIASGDLSHRLSQGAPAGYDPMGKVFDEKVVGALSKGDVRPLLSLDPGLVERAGECGLGPIITMFGALDGLDTVPEVVSYEGPFGVGYCVATFVVRGAGGQAARPGEEGAAASPPGPGPDGGAEGAGPPGERGGGGVAGAGAGAGIGAGAGTGIGAGAGAWIRAGIGAGIGAAGVETVEGGAPAHATAVPHPFVRLARLALETYVRDGRRISPPSSSPGLDRRAGAFVSLKKRGQLRGCIGTLEPTAPTLAEEVIRNAIQAGTADPRFAAVTADELRELTYSVDVLEPAEPVSSLDELDPKVYGVIVNKDRRTGVLLPDLEGLDTAESQVAVARQKAGIAPDETGVRLFRFKVTRYR
ncbi:MAG: AmmeMemoRadiSam system protein A [Bacillota bacterium]|jgi:AmmeMemoRadiSam system protein A